MRCVLHLTFKLKMRFTNVVVAGDVKSFIDLKTFSDTCEGEYRRVMQSALSWKLPHAPVRCLLFSTGRVSCAGARGVDNIRLYAKALRRMGYVLCDVRVLTRSAVHTLSGSVRYAELVQGMGAIYEPELFHAAMLRRGNVHFTVFATGKVVMTGIKDMKCVDDVVFPTLMEMDIYCTG